MRMWRLVILGIFATLGTLACPPSHATIIYSDLGPADSFDTAAGNGYVFGNLGLVGGSGSVSLAVPFTTQAGLTGPLGVTSIEVALANAVNSTSFVNAVLFTNNGGVPGTSLLNGVGLLQLAGQAAPVGSLRTFSYNNALLAPGTSYFLVLSVNNAAVLFANNQGAVGMDVSTNSGPYVPQATPTGAIRVNAIPGVPEPATVAPAVLGSLVVGLVALRKRRA